MVKADTRIAEESITICKLKTADILLIHTKRSLWSWIIRFGTRCYWNHALIICSVGNWRQGYENTLVVDAKTGGSIEIGRVNEYLDKLNKYDVAVKRLEANWFQDNSQPSRLGFRSRICNIAANEVDVKLGSKLVELIDQTIRQITIVFRFVRRKIKGRTIQPRLPWNIKPIQLKAFTCGGFVQWCYYKGVSQMVEEGSVDRSKLKEVLFNQRARKKVTPFELLTTTPADLANCDKLSWKYIIKDGLMREVTSGKEVSLITIPA